MTLSALYSYYSQHLERHWIMKDSNVLSLFYFVKKNNFKNILDLGTGIGVSSAVVALANKESGKNDFTIDTIENFEKCYELAQKLLPEELKPYVKFHRVDTEVWNNPNIPYQFFSTFKELPGKEYDLIIVDGPGPWLENDDMIDLPNGDLMKMLIANKVKPGAFVFIDGRINFFKTIDRYYSDNFYILEEQNKNCNILEKKDNELKFHDSKKENLIYGGYFSEYGEKKS